MINAIVLGDHSFTGFVVCSVILQDLSSDLSRCLVKQKRKLLNELGALFLLLKERHSVH